MRRLVFGVILLLAPLSVGGCAKAEPSVPAELSEVFADDGEMMVSIENIATAHDLGMELTLVDSRTALDFEFGHLPGAINVPYFDVEANLDRLPRDGWIVTYCECPNSEARQVYEELISNGFTYVKVIEEGMAPWRDDMQRELEYSQSQNPGAQG